MLMSKIHHHGGSMAQDRMTLGWPKAAGIYDCRLEDGREVMVDCHPYCDDLLPDGNHLDANIVAFRRIPGQHYRTV
jgi:hypothetical protein